MKKLATLSALLAFTLTFSACEIAKKEKISDLPESLDVEKDLDGTILELEDLLGEEDFNIDGVEADTLTAKFELESGLQILTGSELSLEGQLKTTEDNKMQEVLNLSRKEALAVCLKDKSVRLYGTSWCSHCQKQKMLFGKEAFKRLGFVDCDKNKEECIEVGVRGYPTWVINEELFPGVQSLESLAKKTACKF